MKNIVFIFLMMASGYSAIAQSKDSDKAPMEESQYGSYSIIFQLSSSDTLVHKALMRQIGNIRTVAPQTKIEVVCHGPGLTMLQTDKSIVIKKLDEFAAAGVEFNACEFTMKEKKVKREELVASSGTVEAGIMEIVKKQSEGWFYIKAGF